MGYARRMSPIPYLSLCCLVMGSLPGGCVRNVKSAGASESTGQVLRAPGAPSGCTSAYVFPAEAPAGAASSARFRQVQGDLDGVGWGACQLMGPVPGNGGYLWAFMVWQPAWTGQLSCRIEDRSSPILEVGDSSRPADPGIKVKWLLAQSGVQPGTIPSTTAPCPTAPPASRKE